MATHPKSSHTNEAKDIQTSSITGNSESQTTESMNSFKDNHLSAVSVDIIASIPYEIVSHIFTFLPIEAACICTQVNHTWRTRLFQCPEPWHTIDASNNAIVHNLPISQHVESLLFAGTPTPLRRDLHLLQTRDFSNLKSLTVEMDYLEEYMSQIDDEEIVDVVCEHLYDALSNVSQSLVKLVVEGQLAKPGISLNRILSICRKLTTLKINGYIAFDHSLSLRTSLTDAYLDLFDSAISLYDLEPIFSNSPHLRHFTLNCDMEDCIIPVIGNHCPNLSSIITNLDYFRKHHSKPIQARLEDGHQADKLHCLVLHYLLHPLPLLSLFQKCRDTLRTLCLAPADGAPFEDWQRFSSFTLPALTYLQISTANIRFASIRTHLPAMIKSNPSIETLVLQEFYDHTEGADSAATYDAIAQLPHLSCLRLINFGIRGEAFLRLLESFSSLRVLEISSCNGCVANVLDRVARISSLEDLTILAVDIDVLIQEFEDFLLSAARHLTRLASLTLGMMRFTDRDAQIVTTFESLENLTLVRPDEEFNESDERLRLLRDHIRHVQIIN